jgi:fibrillarin-like pre-rRNA processing protein
VDATRWPGIFRRGRDFFTVNADPGHRVYGEDLVREGETEYRRWDPWRSKLAALLVLGGIPAEIPAARKLLYLGGAHGTTVSHLADLLPEGRLHVVEKSPASFAPLLHLSERRANVFPLLADAQLPERYRARVGQVDFLYQDVAQRNQGGIFAENARAALQPGGRGLLMLKVRSVTQSRPVRSVVAETRAELARHGLEVVGSRELAPFSREHWALSVRFNAGDAHRSASGSGGPGM